MAVVCVFTAAPAWAGDVTVTVLGVRNGKGEVRFALYDRASEFPLGKHFGESEVPAAPGEVTTVFKNVPPGIYAVAVYHDENDNDKMDLLFDLLPQEGYGFSNDAKVVVVPPTFAAASFKVPADGIAIRLHMVY